MGDDSDIEWTRDGKRKGATWEPVLGCEHASPGCKHCYAEKLIAVRLGRNPATPRYHGLAVVTDGGAARWARDEQGNAIVRLQTDHLEVPLHWRDPRRAFVCSRSDLFHPLVPDEYILAVHTVMAVCPESVFLLLTKRSERLPEFYSWIMAMPEQDRLMHGIECAVRYGSDSKLLHRRVVDCQPFPLRNVQVGVSVESSDYLERLDHLMAADVALRWASFEPLLGDLGDLSRWLPESAELGFVGPELRAKGFTEGPVMLRRGAKLDWAVLGGESERPGVARRCAVEWIRGALRQLQRARVPTFVKQLGSAVTIQADEWRDGMIVGDPYTARVPLKHKKGALVSEWHERGLGDLDVREVL